MKDYKKILEGVVNIINTAEEFDIGFDNICAYIDENCPELKEKESEDEEIRREIRNFIWEYPDKLPERDKWLAWLEEQKTIDVLDEEEIKFADDVDSYRKDMVEFYKKGYNAGREAEKRDWLKKQCEQNLTIKSAEESLGIDSATYNEIVDECIYGEQKPADKVEPKFHKGDWTVSNLDKKTRQISEVHFDEYNSYYVLNGKSVNIEEYDRLHHLWTIQDAKAGDILVSSITKKPFVYNGNYTSKSLGAYFGLNYISELLICDSYGNSWTDLIGVQPATEEQRNMLFKKLHDSDYKWDSEKKDLWHKYL